jgi:hypothetical protein
MQSQGLWVPAFAGTTKLFYDDAAIFGCCAGVIANP